VTTMSEQEMPLAKIPVSELEDHVTISDWSPDWKPIPVTLTGNLEWETLMAEVAAMRLQLAAIQRHLEQNDPPEEPAPTEELPPVHRSITPFIAICGADVPNQCTINGRWEGVTCEDCLTLRSGREG
jgi:hypothetical protein